MGGLHSKCLTVVRSVVALLPLLISLPFQVLQPKMSRRQTLELQKCEEILNKLVKYRFSWPFR